MDSSAICVACGLRLVASSSRTLGSFLKRSDAPASRGIGSRVRLRVDPYVTASSSGYVLIGAVALVGVLHTLVPDHWAPIALLARQRGWSDWQTARAAALAGIGHTVSTLLIAVIVWVAGVLLAAHYGHLMSALSSLALIGFGGWIAVTSFYEIRASDRKHAADTGHVHVHRHEDDVEHRHWHEHRQDDMHASAGDLAIHAHDHSEASRTALLLILGSSPMIEGIPAFFAASHMGVGQLLAMSVAFAASTIVTYVTVSVAAARGIQRIRLGAFERYGEVLSGSFIALLGIAFLMLPQL
jgi:putative Mn2+ efflux pump MntP